MALKLDNQTTGGSIAGYSCLVWGCVMSASGICADVATLKIKSAWEWCMLVSGQRLWGYKWNWTVWFVLEADCCSELLIIQTGAIE